MPAGHVAELVAAAGVCIDVQARDKDFSREIKDGIPVCIDTAQTATPQASLAAKPLRCTSQTTHGLL